MFKRLFIIVVFLAITGIKSEAAWNLSWQDNSNNEDGFIIEKEDSPGVWTNEGQVGANVTTHFDTTTATFRCYRVKAFNSVGDSAYSSIACTPTIPTVPNAPSGLAVTR